MNLKPELLSAMTTLGVTDSELDLLRTRMLSAVSSLDAHLNALDAQIRTLESQRSAIAEELAQATITVSKLVE